MKHLLLAIMLFTISIVSAQTKTYQLSTHILDANEGKPASHVKVRLDKFDALNNAWKNIDEKFTDDNGRIGDFLETNIANKGIYRLRFETKEYYNKLHKSTFYPYIDVVFELKGDHHYHVPLTLSPFGYATYRGS